MWLDMAPKYYSQIEKWYVNAYKKNLPVKGDLCEEDSQLLGTDLYVGHHLC